MNLTAANQLTILRMLIIPGFVILLMYGYRGWALVSFLVAGITDLLDGLIARWAGQKTTLGAWLDPMADKLLLVTMFVMLTLPGIGLANRLPLWFTVLVISRDVAIVADRGGREPGGRAPDIPAFDLRQDRQRRRSSAPASWRCTSTISSARPRSSRSSSTRRSRSRSSRPSTTACRS